MTTYRDCRHGRFREGHCFRCEFARPGVLARIGRWLDANDHHLERYGWVVIWLTALWLTGAVALR